MTMKPQIGFALAAALVVAAGIGFLSLRSRLSVLEQQISQTRADLEPIVAKLKADNEDSIPSPVEEPKTTAEAKGVIGKLPEKPAAEVLAVKLAEIDAWMVKPDEEKSFVAYKLQQQTRLRELVKSEVVARQDAALKATTSKDAQKEHATAGRVLALYPMSEDVAVIEDAKRLYGRQAEVASRLDVVRRQRYNRWAVERIEQGIDYYNANKSRWNPLNDNTSLIAPLVSHLGEIDPAILEPAVLELYNYVIDQTKGSLSEKNKLEFAKQLTDPTIARKTFGDF